jgi:gliding motility-associated-like protein
LKARLFIIIVFLTGSIPALANHIAGGELSYKYLGVGTVPGTAQYSITLKLFRQCSSTGAKLDPQANITIFRMGLNTFEMNLQVPISGPDILRLTTPGPCIINPPEVCYEVGTYTTVVILPITTSGYVIAYQRGNRVTNLENVIANSVGATYVATIPGTAFQSDAPVNSTPVFNGEDTVLVCKNNTFYYNFSASDADGDRLEYVFEAAYGYSGPPNPSSAAPPPYNSLNYRFGFTPDAPMGPDVKLNTQTGMMSGTAPDPGVYVVTVAVLEYRGNFLINRHRKDLHIEVADCSIAAANLEIEYVNCDNFTITFQNKNSSTLIQSYEWSFFNQKGIKFDTKTEERPTITFPDTGVYSISLITNKDLLCSDTGSTIAKIFPEFKAEIDVVETCTTVPYQFTDKSSTTFGKVNYWKWIFTNPITGQIDSSRLQNPSHLFPSAGNFNVSLISATDKGCRDTLVKTVKVLDKPILSVTNDTVMCISDAMQLQATGTGTFSWSPANLLDDPAIANPKARPTAPTTFSVTLTSAPGCVGTESVFVDVKRNVSLQIRSDTTICLGDPVTLTAISDGLSFTWSPATTLDDPVAKSPLAKPTGTTTYQVKANIGSCEATNAVKITTIPYPVITLTPNTNICFGDTISLFADGGVDFRWSPSSGLSALNIQNPRAFPKRTSNYRVTVWDDKGCPKPSFANVVITVAPPVQAFAGRDTAIVTGQPLQLTGSGGDYYTWTPVNAMSNPNINNPIANLDEDTQLSLKVTTLQGCFAYDTLNVKVFKTQPDIFVPTAFSPNNDGLNDKLTPIPVGIQQFDYFRIFNRWGQLVFSTHKIGEGWDGRLKALEQGNGSFVWQVRGVDYTGRVIDKNGVVTVIK